ncbi:zinc ribbon domain-containing protein [Fontibacillus panacisegetis]|uniref:zinc ribbon domain-containing protein n=1 Tax=Fontibacillus panacisegetis TaxID=670482 RepID=UPI000B84C6D8|nr:zinc ribbon domain-containing protein [Fontibacillus panacisegetis]
MEIEENRYRWSSGGLSNLFKNPAYIGGTVHYQYQKVWTPGRKLQSHPDRTKVHENLIVGITKCADCGKSMNLNCVTNERKKGVVRTYSLYCDTYKKYSKLECRCHYTNYKNLCRIVLESINSLISKVELDEDKIMKRLRKLKNQGAMSDDNTSKKVAKKENGYRKSPGFMRSCMRT